MYHELSNYSKLKSEIEKKIRVNRNLEKKDNRLNFMFTELMIEKKLEICSKTALVAIIDNTALNGTNIHYKITENTLIGNNGASFNMKTSLEEIFDLRKVSGGIKVGSGRVLKILKIGKFKGENQQEDGSKRTIVIKEVY